MKIIDMAGYMREAHLWQMLGYVSRAVVEGEVHCEISADKIDWDGERFMLSSKESGAPLAENQVWQLGAAAFYLFMGCHVFNGQGRGAQKANSPLPYMRKSMPELSDLVCKMLSYDASARPTMKEVCDVAQRNIERLQSERTERPTKNDKALNDNTVKDFWPDDFE